MVKSGILVDYEFDPVTGNLKSRNLHGTEEFFFYDTDGKELNRLAGTGPDEFTVSETYNFADNGNITSKACMGPYIYENDRKNAVAQVGIQQMGSQVDLQTINYNHFNSASEIKNLDDELRVNLEYGADDQRRMAKYWDFSGAEDVLLKTRIYAGAFEKQISADLSEIEVNYISAGGQLVAMYVVEDGVGSYYYPHQDHLGSIIHITDASGDIVYTQSFDAWGRTRNPNDLSYNNIPERPDWLWRGYTGHEHLDEFGLINMNGRLYDPVVGRMLSPDNYVQNPDFSQSYNRYSYVWNNPLKFHDPDGEWVVGLIVGAIVGAYIGGVLAEEGELNPTQWAWDGTTWTGVITGGIIGGALGAGYAAGHFAITIGGNIGGAAFGVQTAIDQGAKFTWTNNAGGSGSYNLSGNGNQPSNWINPDALAAIVEADMNHQYTPLYTDVSPEFGGPLLASLDGEGMFFGSAQGENTFPSFNTLWNNYPEDNPDGTHAKPSADPYLNQCAIRVGVALQKSGVDISTYPRVNVTTEGYPRSSKGLADWIWQNYGAPNIMTQSKFESNYWSHTGIIYIAPPIGGIGHIDLFNKGATGSGYYVGSEIWFWNIH